MTTVATTDNHEEEDGYSKTKTRSSSSSSSSRVPEINLETVLTREEIAVNNNGAAAVTPPLSQSSTVSAAPVGVALLEASVTVLAKKAASAACGVAHNVQQSSLQRKLGSDNNDDNNDDDKIPWDEYYYQLAYFKATEGHTSVPLDYVCEDDNNINLCKWVIQEQAELLSARLLAQKEKKKLAPDIQQRIEKLKAIGLELKVSSPSYSNDDDDDDHQAAVEEAEVTPVGQWQRKQLRRPSRYVPHIKWEDYYKLLLEYKKEHGHLYVPATYQTPNGGFKLGAWVRSQRYMYAQQHMSQERIARLTAIEFPWKVVQYYSKPMDWQDWFKLLLAYKTEHNGDLSIPSKYTTPEGVRLGYWAANQRKTLKTRLDKDGNDITDSVSKQRILQLTAIGFPLTVKHRSKRTEPAKQLTWEGYYNLLLEYKKQANKNGSYLHVPFSYMTAQGIRLGRWAAAQRQSFKPYLVDVEEGGKDIVTTGAELSPIIIKRISMLIKIGFLWNGHQGRNNKRKSEHISRSCHDDVEDDEEEQQSESSDNEI